MPRAKEVPANNNVVLRPGDSVTITVGEQSFTISHKVALIIIREFITPYLSPEQSLWDLTDGIAHVLAHKAKCDDGEFFIPPDGVEAFLSVIALTRAVSSPRATDE